MHPILAVRITSFLDALSYLILLGIAMPLKYLMDQPQAVSMVGRIHGVFFCALAGCLLWALLKKKLTFLDSLKVFVASIIPCLPFFIDSWLKQKEK